MTPTFVESCVDFEVAHLSVLMVQRLPYPEIPTLKRSITLYHISGHEYISQTGSRSNTTKLVIIPVYINHILNLQILFY